MRHTRAFMVPCRACLWFLRNLGSVPLSDGYLLVLGFLILCIGDVASVTTFFPECFLGFRGGVPVLVGLLRLVMLRGVL